jgi:hypothetical protein
MKKKISFKLLLLSILLFAAAGVVFHLFYNGYAATAGSQQLELDRCLNI